MTHSALAITWLGHGTFHFRSPGGQRLLIDPWLEANPKCPGRLEEAVGARRRS